MNFRINVNFEERLLAQEAPDAALGKGEWIRHMNGFGGMLKRYAARPDLFISAFDLELAAGAASGARSEPCLIIVVLLDGQGQGSYSAVDDGASEMSIRYKPGMTYLFYSPTSVNGGYQAVEAHRFRGVEVRVGLDILERLGGLTLFQDALRARHPLHLASSELGWIGAFPSPVALRTSAEQLLDTGFGGTEDLVVEARGLDILTTAIATMREPLFCRSVRFIRNGRQLDEARALMLADLARSWTVGEVARKVGLTEKRLKVDFRAQFGVPVYGFLQRSRLEHAKTMLEAGTSNVTEVSMAVGYANPSHFAKLFRRQYGIQPSALTGSSDGENTASLR